MKKEANLKIVSIESEDFWSHFEVLKIFEDFLKIFEDFLKICEDFWRFQTDSAMQVSAFLFLPPKGRYALGLNISVQIKS